MNKIWLTSDLHFCHNRDFIYEPRGFASVHEMNEAIIKKCRLFLQKTHLLRHFRKILRI